MPDRLRKIQHPGLALCLLLRRRDFTLSYLEKETRILQPRLADYRRVFLVNSTLCIPSIAPTDEPYPTISYGAAQANHQGDRAPGQRTVSMFAVWGSVALLIQVPVQCARHQRDTP
jgi:hypothetical protein